MALWGNNDNVNALGVAGAGVVTLNYSTLEVVGIHAGLVKIASPDTEDGAITSTSNRSTIRGSL